MSKKVYLSVNGFATIDDIKHVSRELQTMNLEVIRHDPKETYDPSIMRDCDIMVAIPSPSIYGDRTYMMVTGKGQYNEVNNTDLPVYIWDRKACILRDIEDLMILDKDNWQQYGIIEVDTSTAYRFEQMYEIEYDDKPPFNLVEEKKVDDTVRGAKKYPVSHTQEPKVYRYQTSNKTSALGRSRRKRSFE